MKISGVFILSDMYVPVSQLTGIVKYGSSRVGIKYYMDFDSVPLISF
jgi:hypothetical protein